MKPKQTLMSKIIRNKYLDIGFLSLVILILVFLVLPKYLPTIFVIGSKTDSASIVMSVIIPIVTPSIKKVASHIRTPEVVKGIYMTACVAGTPSFRAKLLQLVNETEINSIVIDIKDYTGTISFPIDNLLFKDNLGGGCKVKDMAEFVETLHQNNVYVIGRITAFQDPYLAMIKPDWAVKKNSDRTVNWKDRKGISYIDVGNKEMWQYLVELGRESYLAGFDEINYDYIRFPSDGDMSDIYFPWSSVIWAEEKAKLALTLTNIATTSATSTINKNLRSSQKSLVLRSFFEYLHDNFEPLNIPISADLFGMTATNYDDLNIGQILEDAIPNFDYIAPMVYPSHYPVGFLNYKSVAEVNAHPYDIVNYSMAIAVKRLIIASSSPLKLRPWLQDNDYPVPYTPAMVRAQIQATYDAGLTSWMLWDAGNTYTQSALLSN